MKLSYLWAKIFKKIRSSAIKNSNIHSTSKVESGCNVVNSTMDKHSFCGYDCEITNCTIGSFCSIANGVVIGGGMHPYNWVSTSPVFYEGRDSVKTKFAKHKRTDVLETIIGNDVWIGQNVLIKQGVNIGTGAVIGMGSIVTKDIAPYAIVGGTPAKLLKMRFPEEIVEGLLKSEWWELPENDLSKYAKYINNPEQFLTIVNK